MVSYQTAQIVPILSDGMLEELHEKGREEMHEEVNDQVNEKVNKKGS